MKLAIHYLGMSLFFFILKLLIILTHSISKHAALVIQISGTFSIKKRNGRLKTIRKIEFARRPIPPTCASFQWMARGRQRCDSKTLEGLNSKCFWFNKWIEHLCKYSLCYSNVLIDITGFLRKIWENLGSTKWHANNHNSKMIYTIYMIDNQ